jgi:hypothetical protein
MFCAGFFSKREPEKITEYQSKASAVFRKGKSFSEPRLSKRGQNNSPNSAFSQMRLLFTCQ